jgi:hypothetical protein
MFYGFIPKYYKGNSVKNFFAGSANFEFSRIRRVIPCFRQLAVYLNRGFDFAGSST